MPIKTEQPPAGLVRAFVQTAAATGRLLRRSSDRQRVAALTAVTAAAVVGTTDVEGLVDELVAGPGSARPPAVSAPASPAPHRSRAVVALINRVFPPGERRQAVAVARCESGLRNVPGAPNADGSRDWGVFQLNDGAGQWSRSTLASLGGTPSLALNPSWNVRAARRLWTARGWQPWTCGRKLGLA